MDRLKNVLVGIDFSECSLNALEHAARIARWNAAELHLLHVESSWSIAPGDRNRLNGLAASIAGVKVHAHAARGPELEAFLNLVAETSSDLLLLGTYGLLGSYVGSGIGAVTSQCLRQVPTKILVVRERKIPAFRKIVACIDFSPTSDVVLHQAVRVANQEQGQLHLLHVVSKKGDAGRARALLEELGARVADESAFTLETHVLESERPTRGVLGYANTVHPDLVVIGTRGQSDLEYVLLGTTAERVLREVRCCALVVKPPNFVSPRELRRRSAVGS